MGMKGKMGNRKGPSGQAAPRMVRDLVVSDGVES